LPTNADPNTFSLVQQIHLVIMRICVRHFISPTSKGTTLKTENGKRNVSINKEMYQLIKGFPV